MRNLLMVVTLAATPVFAQPAVISPPSVEAPPPAPQESCCAIPALTIVAIEIGATLSSQVNKPGDRFPIKLVEPIKIGESIVVPAGATGEGEVIHTAKKGGYGRAGEMLLAARYIDYQGSRIPLRSLGFSVGHGVSSEGSAMAVGFLISGVMPYFMSGGEMKIESGTKAFAKIAAETVITTKAAPTIPATTAIGDQPK